MKIRSCVLLATLVIAGVGSAAADLPAAEESFTREAAQTSLAEVTMGELARKKGDRDEVKEFAADLVKDHSAVSKELSGIARGKNLSLPTALSAEQRTHVAQLENIGESRFDKAFIDHMIEGHRKSIESFERQASSGSDADLKRFAANTLPTLRAHLERAEEISDDINE